MTYSKDFREATLAYKQKGHTIKQTCETFNITNKTYHNWLTQKQKTGSLTPKKHGPRKRKIDPQKLKTYTEQHPDACLKEIAQQFNCKASSVYNALVKHKLTRKKSIHL
ncbi:MAG: transposase [Nitrososphaerota archaeon]|jgi:transposase|nr:transposase [Nitrososphaerota archaeon]